MDLQSFIFYLVMIVFAGAWWSNYRLRNKALCVYTRASGQEVKKFVTLQDNFVVFDNQQFEIVPDRSRDVWYDEGLFGKLFPTWIKCYHFNSNDYFAEPYKEHGVNWEDPANRQRINSRNDMHGFSENQIPEAEAKKSKFAKYLPWIIGLVVLVVGYYIYTFMANTNARFDAIESYMHAVGG